MEWKEEWLDQYPKAILCPENGLDELLNFLDCPLSNRVKIRTANATERAFRDARRQTLTMSRFTNAKSVDRIIFGITYILNKSW